MGALLALCAIAGCSRSDRSHGTAQIPPRLFASREARERGRILFTENCAICHGQTGDGHGARRFGMEPPPANLTAPPWSDSASAGQTCRAIHDGVQGTAMPSWQILSDQEIWDLVAYIHSLGES
jgi:mono/diheme cytochrome c family protein